MMKLRTYFLTLCCACALLPVNGQQDPMYSMYVFDKMLVNPAFCGSSNWLVATAKYREQFIGLNGRPSTQTINVHSPIQAKHIGIGVKVVRDRIAIINNLAAAADFSYHLNFAGGKLSLGLEAGILNRQINFTDLIVSTQGDKALDNSGKVSSLVPDLSSGIYYQRKQFYAGLSAYHLLKKKMDFGTSLSGSYLHSQTNILVGNVFELSKYISLEPSLLIKYQPGVVQADINAMVYYDGTLGAGVQYRTGDAVVAMLKYNITPGLRIAYSYDITVSGFSGYSKGAHEILLSYGIKLPPPPTQKEMHPRYYF